MSPRDSRITVAKVKFVAFNNAKVEPKKDAIYQYLQFDEMPEYK